MNGPVAHTRCPPARWLFELICATHFEVKVRNESGRVALCAAIGHPTGQTGMAMWRLH
jgi:hypothetical protein